MLPVTSFLSCTEPIDQFIRFYLSEKPRGSGDLSRDLFERNEEATAVSTNTPLCRIMRRLTTLFPSELLEMPCRIARQHRLNRVISVESEEAEFCEVGIPPPHRESVTKAKNVVENPDEPADPEGGGGFAEWAMLTLQALRIELGTSYRQTIDLLSEMPGILDEIGLTRLPHFTVLRDSNRSRSPQGTSQLLLLSEHSPA